MHSLFTSIAGLNHLLIAKFSLAQGMLKVKVKSYNVSTLCCEQLFIAPSSFFPCVRVGGTLGLKIGIET